jgi:hypothetical protein
MDNELVFVLNTSELRNAGFIGSFNDFADELAEEEYIVSGSYDDEGVPVITVVGIEQEALETTLKDHGIDDPSEFTSPVEPGDTATVDDLDTDIDGGSVGDADEPDDEPDGDQDPDEDELPSDEDEVDIIEDDDDDPIIAHDNDDIPDDVTDGDIDEIDSIPSDDDLEDINEEKKVVFPIKGTQNISESLITEILANVKDTFLTKRIKDRVDTLNALKESSDNVKINLNSWSNAKVNGVEIWKYRNVDILDLLSESKKSYKEVYKKFKSLNESMTNDKKRDFVKILKKQKALIEMLESEYRFRNLNEDITIDSSNVDNNTASTDEGQPQDEGTQEATLTSIVFKVKNADEFIKVLTDHGIPSEALKKGSTTPDDGSDGGDQQQDDAAAQPAPDAGMGGSPAAAPAPAPAPGGNPFESLTTPLTKKNKLNEDGNPFDQLAGPQTAPDANLGNPDQPGPADAVDPLASEESADTGEGEEVILTDTSYASKVQQILADVYGYEKEKFEEKIGGEIVDDGSDEGDQTDDNPFNEIDGSDGSDAAGEDDDDEDVGLEDTVSPQDLFGDL